MKRNFIILRYRDCYEVWGSLTTLCEAHGFSYSWLSRKKFPFKYRGIHFVKVRFRERQNFNLRKTKEGRDWVKTLNK